MAIDLQGQLDALMLAYTTGATSISYEGKSIQYRSGPEMQAAIVSLQQQLGQRTTPNSVVMRGDKGW
jgi:hypothetical protein